MSKLVPIKEAANILGVAQSTLRRWEKQGKISPERTKGGMRRYDITKLNPNKFHKPNDKITYAYARVSSHDQKNDLTRQEQVLENYCSQQGWNFQVISDLGSGMNYNKRGLTKLINAILDKNIDRLVITHKDRLLRFGAELVFAICEHQEIEVVILNKNINSSFEEDLAQDVLEIITVFSARLYGARSCKAKKIIDALS